MCIFSLFRVTGPGNGWKEARLLGIPYFREATDLTKKDPVNV
jgi:hypothetical protein